MHDFETVFLDRMELALYGKVKGNIYLKFVGNSLRVDIENVRLNIHYKYIFSNIYNRCLNGETTDNFTAEIIKAYRKYINRLAFYCKL